MSGHSDTALAGGDASVTFIGRSAEAAAGPVIVVGGATTTAQDPREEALWLRQQLGA